MLTARIMATTKKLAALRSLMKKIPSTGETVDAYIIPTDDAHQSEYICAHDDRRSYVSGFDGSSGTAVVTANEAFLWTDGRYYDQANKQLDSNWTLMRDGLPTTPTIGAFLAKSLAKGSKVGVDPKLISFRTWTPMKNELEAADCTLLPVKENLVDAIWSDQPPQTSNQTIVHELKFSGETVQKKLESIRAALKEKNAEAVVVTALDEIAYALNLRGSDIPYNPVFFSYLIITLNKVFLFIDQNKLPATFSAYEKENEVKIDVKPYDQIEPFLVQLLEQSTGKFWISPTSSFSLNHLIPEKRRVQEITPIALLKAVKNPVEVEGLKNCHVRDGLALCQYFAWLSDAVAKGQAIDEISGATKLESFRAKQDHYMGLSFTTISSSGPNGAVIHYHPAQETNRPITKEEIYLCDSGAQYKDGTTDVTRTWHFGTPTAHHKDCFTRVLKGQITIATAIFPRKVKGQMLDTLARKALWDVGLDYKHGTGHGIGHFLNVHEGPMQIGMRVMPDDPGLQENMFVSNEPGYYESNNFGIRIEDIVQIVKANIARDFDGRGALAFETVTMCPIHTKMIDAAMLTEKERKHLNDYHKCVLDTLGPLLKQINDDFTYKWLERETQPI
ncbi:xaa-Pro aminopeptidase ApepP isoform X1 [Phlebotomus argentipes]|uniref:xaa-Pro aminopeptidase ApepP isoform X1 n=2 Tax=Phlebotomus argentipes TaxID=94469 RepID=UPI002892ACBD|nr:xaa-Pro aminopeptidase ApepP isoform X1 [Phlebotomus argentipes]